MASSLPDAAFRALADGRRRRILMALLDHDPGADLSISDVVGPDRSDPATHELVLHHEHLPLLEERGFVDWNREAGTIGTGPSFEEIRPLLALLDRHRDELPDCWI